jgi:signal transduction histidine kinase
MSLNASPDEKLISQLFDTQPDSVVWFVPLFGNGRRGNGDVIAEFEVKYCNAAASKILGAPQRAIIGSKLLASSLMDEVSRKIIFEQCVEVWQSDTPLEFTYHSPGFDKYFNVQRSKVMDGILSITRDRTAEVKAEKERAEQSKLLDNILNSSINAVYTLKSVYDKDHEIVDFTITHVNKIFCQMARRSSHELLGKSFLMLYPNTKPAGVFERNCKILRDGKPVRQEVHYVGEGIDAWYDSSATKAGEDTLVISFNDITALKNSSVELESSNQQLKHSNERLLEFTQVASHDLNEPLRKILTYTDLLNDRYGEKLEFGARDYLTRINKTARRMQSLINDLLSFSQVTNVTHKFRKVSLENIVKEVVNDLETVINERHAKLTIGDLPVIKGDKTQLRQVFQNLISNALKFQKENNRPIITIESSVVTKKNRQNENGQFHMIQVRDNGIGFEESQAEKIFQLFQRLHSKNEFDGTGIGLAIVQKAMENHNGFIEAKSEPGAGSSFNLFFPKSKG